MVIENDIVDLRPEEVTGYTRAPKNLSPAFVRRTANGDASEADLSLGRGIHVLAGRMRTPEIIRRAHDKAGAEIDALRKSNREI